MQLLQKLPVVLSLLLAVGGAPALAATYTVVNTNDSGVGSLRQAMLDARATADDDEIVFAPATNGTPIVLASPLPNLQASGGGLIVTGNGVAHTVISGDGQYRILTTEAQDPIRLTLQALTLRGGRVGSGERGGAVRFVGTGSSSLTIDSVEFTDNQASIGSAVASSAPVVVRNSTFQGNYATGFATAMFIDNTSVQTENVTVSGDTSMGAFIHVEGAAGTGRFVHLSMANNTGSVGVGAYGGASITLINSIVTTSGTYDLEVRTGGTVDAANSVHNVIGTMNGGGLVQGVNGNQVDVTNPLVGPLGDYGGSIRTLPLLPGSPALDAGTTAVGLPATDQRGLARVGAPDVGAFESRGFVLSAASGGAQAAYVNTAFANPLVVQVTANAPTEPVEGGQVVFSAPGSGASAALAAPTTVTLGSDGLAQTSATANASAGSYNVAAASGALATAFALTNKAAAGVVANPTSGLVTTEAGGTASFTVVLNSEPGALVTVPVASTNTAEGTVSAATLTFTPANWNVPQTVTVTGVDDALADGPVAYGITVGPSSSSDAYYVRPQQTVAATNANNDFTLGGTVTGLSGAGLVLQNNGGGDLSVASAGSFTFAAPVVQGSAYSVTVRTQPPGQTCTVSQSSGTVGMAPVTNVQVACAASTYTLGGTATGLTASNLVLRNGGEDLPVTASGAFVFTQPVAHGGSYAVTIAAQPTGQRCTVANASGNNMTANVGNLQVACAPYFEGTTVPANGAGDTGSATFTGGGPACRFDLGATGFEAAPAALPPGRTLPQGLLRIQLVGCTAAVTMEVTWPEPVAGYTKYGLAASTDTQPSFFTPANLAISGRTVRFTLTDGQQGDDDWTADGSIADPSGPTTLLAGAQAIPTLSEGGLLLLSAALLGLLALRRRA